MSLALADNQIVVTCEDTVFINRRIEGNFPNYKQLLPDGYATRATIEVDKLVASVRRASLLGSTSSPVRFDLNNASQTVQISAASQDVGSAQEIISCAIEAKMWKLLSTTPMCWMASDPLPPTRCILKCNRR